MQEGNGLCSSHQLPTWCMLRWGNHDCGLWVWASLVWEAKARSKLRSDGAVCQAPWAEVLTSREFVWMGSWAVKRVVRNHSILMYLVWPPWVYSISTLSYISRIYIYTSTWINWWWTISIMGTSSSKLGFPWKSSISWADRNRCRHIASQIPKIGWGENAQEIRKIKSQLFDGSRSGFPADFP